MTQIFHPATNTLSKATIFGGLFVVAAVSFGWDRINRSPYATEQDVVRDQPVPFSHQHHVSGLGIDCRFCHTSVEKSAFAGLPATEICMSCHAQIWRDSPMLAPVRESARTGEPLRWTRVHDLPDFVYFNHSVHVRHGIGCESCHGRVDEMPLLRKAQSLQMSWCLDCHQHPDRHVREQNEIYVFGNAARTNSGDRGAALVKEFGIEPSPLLDCAICHR